MQAWSHQTFVLQVFGKKRWLCNAKPHQEVQVSLCQYMAQHILHEVQIYLQVATAPWQHS